MDQTPDERIATALEEIRDTLLREIDAPMTASPVKPAALPEPVETVQIQAQDRVEASARRVEPPATGAYRSSDSGS
jgi:hypothetical protein